MPRPSRHTIRSRIRTAVVDQVAVSGMGALSVGSVAKRAHVSAGTIYLHFTDKEDMLQSIYLDIKTDLHACMMQAADAPDSARMIRAMWMALFDYIRAHPNDFLFVEFAGAAQVLTPEQAAGLATQQADIRALLQRAIDDGTLADLPLHILTVLLVSPAMHLARQALLGGNAPSADDIDLTFAQVWRAITPPLSRVPLPASD